MPHPAVSAAAAAMSAAAASRDCRNEPSMLEAPAKERESVRDRLAKIDCLRSLRARRGHTKKAGGEAVDPLNFLNDDLSEVFAKIRLIETLRQHLGKCPNGHKRVLNFVGDA